MFVILVLVETGGVNCDLDVLEAAVDRAAEAPVSTMGVDELADRVCRLQTINNKFDSLRSAVTDGAEQACVGPRNGMRNTVQYVAQRSRVDPACVRADLRLGSWVGHFPQLERAFAEGRISKAHLDKVRRLDTMRTRLQLKNDQELIIGWAESVDFRDFGNVLQYWLIAADPDGEEPRDQIEANRLTLRDLPDGSMKFEGHADPLTASAIRTAIGYEAQKLRAADLETGAIRPVRQLQLLALMNLIARGHRRPDGAAPTPLIDIVISQSVAEDMLARIAEPSTDPLAVSYDNVDGRCELIDGTPIHPHYVMAAMAVGRFRRHVFDSRNRVIETSFSRNFPPWMKHVLVIESRGKCSTRGCDAPFGWLHADHVVPHGRKGPTALGNGQSMCDPDNKWKGG